MKMQVNTTVMVHDPDTQLPVLFGPDSGELPDWAAERITNPEVIVGGPGEHVSTAPTPVRGVDTNAALVAMAGVTDETTRGDLLKIAEQMGLEPGKDFNKSADKRVIWGAIQHRAAELSG